MAVETKLTVGKSIRFALPMANPQPLIHPQDFATHNAVDLTVELTTTTIGPFTFSGGGSIANVSPGVNPDPAKAHRNFNWLMWFPGLVSYVPLNRDVLSGPFSGCWMVVFRLNGVQCVGHIGLDAPGTPVTQQAKVAWSRFANAFPGDLIGGFRPSDEWPNAALPPRQPGEGAPDIFGLVTQTGEMYSFCTYNTFGLRRIAGVKQVMPKGPATLSSLFPPTLPPVPTLPAISV
jgi:hypothetical protein